MRSYPITSQCPMPMPDARCSCLMPDAMPDAPCQYLMPMPDARCPSPCLMCMPDAPCQMPMPDAHVWCPMTHAQCPCPCLMLDAHAWCSMPKSDALCSLLVEHLYTPASSAIFHIIPCIQVVVPAFCTVQYRRLYWGINKNMSSGIEGIYSSEPYREQADSTDSFLRPCSCRE